MAKKWRAWELGYYELMCSRLGGRIESTFYYALLVENVVRDTVGDQSCSLHLNLPPRFSLEVPTCVLVQRCLAPETESVVHSSHHTICEIMYSLLLYQGTASSTTIITMYIAGCSLWGTLSHSSHFISQPLSETTACCSFVAQGQQR